MRTLEDFEVLRDINNSAQQKTCAAEKSYPVQNLSGKKYKKRCRRGHLARASWFDSFNPFPRTFDTLLSVGRLTQR